MNTRPSKIEKTLYTLMQYYAVTRQAGHTTAMLEGVKHTDGAVLVLTHNFRYGESLKRLAPNTIPVSLDCSMEAMVGRKAPMVVDNAALHQIASSAFSEIQSLRDMVDGLNQTVKDQLETIKSLQQKKVPWYKRLFARSQKTQKFRTFETKHVEPNKSCSCLHCNPNAWWMVVCSKCGNKRCPHATYHKRACTNSNEPGQPGSVY